VLKYIAEWLEFVLTVAALLIVASVAVITYFFAAESGAGVLLAGLAGFFGIFLGFMVASVILGIPIVLVRINSNIEDTKQILSTLSIQLTKSDLAGDGIGSIARTK